MKRYAKYKDSGIEWVGEIPITWKTAPIKYVTNCMDSKRVPIEAGLRGNMVGDIPYWGAGNIVDYVNDFIFNEELVLLGEDGAPFFDKSRPVAFYVNEKIWANNHIHVLKTNDMILAKYLTFTLNTVDYNEYINGSILNKLTQSDMNGIKIPLPPLATQQAIVGYLDRRTTAIDTLIADKQKLIDLFKEKRQAIISETVTKGLDKTAKMKDSGIEWIGEIPEGWIISKIRYAIEKIGDIDHYMPDSVTDGKPYIMTGDLLENASAIDFVSCKQISDEDYLVLSRKIKPVIGDIIFARYATIGTICYVDIEKDFLVSYSCVTIHPNNVITNGKYLFYYLKSYAFFQEVTQYINSNTQGNVGIDSLSKVRFMLPPLDQQQATVDYLERKTNAIDSFITDINSQIEKLKAYRKSVISEAVTGKVAI
ncbi:MAG: restriction endonuclease subunit [Anaerocolumna sp.]|jgi:type I restriction enzyme S subunit|nr:restriction endonuclease subunit [Clostridia bacterium]MDF2951018.1 restriction endonuclease subunit [Anaerocolumna sp.]